MVADTNDAILQRKIVLYMITINYYVSRWYLFFHLCAFVPLTFYGVTFLFDLTGHMNVLC